MKALTKQGYGVNCVWGIGHHGRSRAALEVANPRYLKPSKCPPCQVRKASPQARAVM